MELTLSYTEDFANFVQPIAGDSDALVFQLNAAIAFYQMSKYHGRPYLLYLLYARQKILDPAEHHHRTL